MSTPPLGSPHLRRADTALNSLKKSPTLKRKHTPSKNIAHLFNPKTSFDSEYRLKHLKIGLANLEKFYKHEIQYVQRQNGEECEIAPHIQVIIKIIHTLKSDLQQIDTFDKQTSTFLVEFDIPPTELFTLKTRILHIDPEEGAHFSRLKSKIENSICHVRRKQEIDILTFLLNSSRSIHDLYLLIHSFRLGAGLKEELVQMLKPTTHKALAPVALPTPKIETKPIYEVLRLFESFKTDHAIGCIQINGKKHDCGKASLKDSLQAFIQILYQENPQTPEEENALSQRAMLEAAKVVDHQETPILKVLRAMTFNAQFQSAEYFHSSLKASLNEKLKVKKISSAHLPSVYILNSQHFSVIHHATYEALEQEAAGSIESEARAHPVLIFDAFNVLTFAKDAWHEDLHIKNIQILDPRHNKFLEKCFSNYQKGKVGTL